MWRFALADSYRSVLEDTTEEQKKILIKFRESLDVELNHRHTDELLIKFLRAKNFNLRATKKIFLNNYYNRLCFGVNTILDTFQKPEVAQKYEATSILGFARDGTLIRYMATGHLDMYGFIMSMSCLDLCLYFSHIMEQDAQALEEENLKTGKNVTEVTYVMDLEGFSIQHVLHKNVIEMGLDLTSVVQDCYPEMWRNVLVVNAPKIFHTAFNLFKSVIRSHIRERIQIVDKASTKYTLLRYIDEDVLPVFLGGNRVDSKGDALCREFLCFGGQVPEKFFSENNRNLLAAGDPGVRVVTIGTRSTFNQVWVAKEAGTTFHLVARTEGGSIYLCTLYKELGPDPDHPELPGEFEFLDVDSDDSEYKQISVEMRSQMHCAQEECKLQMPWPGIYITRFSNANNWFTPRKLFLKCSIIPPETKSSSQ